MAKLLYSSISVKQPKHIPVISSIIYKRASNNDPNELSIDVNGSISGIVKVNGVPIKNANVALYFRDNRCMINDALTDSDGKYIFRNLDRSQLKKYYVVCLDTNQNSPYNYTLVQDHLSAE